MNHDLSGDSRMTQWRSMVLKYGTDHVRKLRAKEQRALRALNTARGGHKSKNSNVTKMRTWILIDGVKHNIWCTCYDCQYGEIADLKRIRAGKQPVLETIERSCRKGRDPAKFSVRTPDVVVIK